MVVHRTRHTATLLPDGRVLVVGGMTATSPYAYSGTAEIYDPVNNTWSAAGTVLAGGLSQHTATLLADGRVFVAGGDGGSGLLATAFFYAPSTNSWSPAASLSAAQRMATATLLPDGRVLVVPGIGPSGLTANCGIYTPSTNSWASAGSLPFARYMHTATLLPDGRVLVAGGRNSLDVSQSSAMIYDTWSTGTTSAAGAMTTARRGPTATLLPNGKVLLAGGRSANGTRLSSADLYDHTARTFGATGAMATARQDHSATLLPNGHVLVAGGWGGSLLTSSELYDPGNGQWSAGAALNSGRRGHTATLLADGAVLAVGGMVDATTYLARTEAYSPASNQWAYTAGDLSTGRGYHTATLLQDGRALVVGGWSSGGALGSAELFDPITRTWAAAASLAGRPGTRVPLRDAAPRRSCPCRRRGRIERRSGCLLDLRPGRRRVEQRRNAGLRALQAPGHAAARRSGARHRRRIGFRPIGHVGDVRPARQPMVARLRR